MVIVLYP